jgi:hypothetical protein
MQTGNYGLPDLGAIFTDDSNLTVGNVIKAGNNF